LAEGLIQFKLDDKWGLIDKTGKQIVPPKYDYMSTLSGGLAQIRIDYEITSGFHVVKEPGPWGLIDKTGKEVVSPK
jgi:hypothetical protein